MNEDNEETCQVFRAYNPKIFCSFVRLKVYWQDFINLIKILFLVSTLILSETLERNLCFFNPYPLNICETDQL